MHTKFSLIKWICFIPFLLLMLFAYYHAKQWRRQYADKQKNSQLGQQFELTELKDSTGRPASIDFGKVPVTILDFWFANCPACIEEMEQFENLLKGKESRINIISISIDGMEKWRNVLQGKNQRLAFIAKPLANWQHYVIQPAQGQYASAGDLVSQRFGISNYPAVFVVNQQGKISAVPESAVAYIKENAVSRSSFFSFITDPATFTSLKTMLLLLLSVVLYLWLFKKIIAAKRSR